MADNSSLLDWETQLEETASDLTRNDRFSTLLIGVITLLAVMLGLVLQQTSVTQTWRYVSRTAGLEANYPAGWLVDESGPYVARLRSPGNRPFKTQFLITTVPSGGQTSVRNVLDTLTLQRSVSLSAYRVLSVEEVNSGSSTFTRMRFAFVDADPNPFIQRLPVVVLGMDVVIIDGNRAIILTYMADQDTFDSGMAAFERFLSSLTY